MEKLVYINNEGQKFVIEEHESSREATLYMFEVDSNISSFDYLCEDVEACKEKAYLDFKIPMDKWQDAS